MHTSTSPDRLIYMANQIGTFFNSQGQAKAVPGIAEHIHKFWDPRMRKALLAKLDAGEPDINEIVQQAVREHRARLEAGIPA